MPVTDSVATIFGESGEFVTLRPQLDSCVLLPRLFIGVRISGGGSGGVSGPPFWDLLCVMLCS